MRVRDILTIAFGPSTMITFVAVVIGFILFEFVLGLGTTGDDEVGLPFAWKQVQTSPGEVDDDLEAWYRYDRLAADVAVYYGLAVLLAWWRAGRATARRESGRP